MISFLAFAENLKRKVMFLADEKGKLSVTVFACFKLGVRSISQNQYESLVIL